MGARWPALVGVVVALIIHVAVVMVLLWHEPETGAQAPGTGGIKVGLGQTGGTPPGAEAVEPENAEADSAREPVESVEPAVTKPEDARTEAVKAEPVAPVAADADDPQIAVAVDERTGAEPVKPASAETAPTETTETATTAPAETASDEAPEEVVSDQVGESGSGDQSGQQVGEGTDREDDSGAGGDPGAKADYTDRIQAHLARHKEYPRRARQQRHEGTTQVTFTFNRAGEILDYRIGANSDHPILDRATRRMMERANPLPAMPDAVPGEQMTLTVPVAYRLR
ncbi:energy transducer TonB [Spiribacter vilamensis]|uniref:Outer membrane transport energization protein TonB n=1 Tax=Spiribacter vilamensis TaxID=531306 RepID=A0A4Q8D0G0_9GAMM|nr:energy transducer TonB [Spiribacter vilamensis]RZU98700.1 outer membrane transport energization protein TonB [Spiribacter vilamensis]TVO62274.1 energy transducer TonB [Spiribacter vilamensis]